MEPVRILTPAQMEMIDQAAGEILEKTGMIFQSDRALSHLERFGCAVDRPGGRVKIPRAVSRAAVEKMRRDYLAAERPERMPVRFSHVRFRPAPYQVHQDFTVSAGGFCPFICDLEGRRRSADGRDVLCALNLVNHLDQVDTTGLPVSDQTVPPEQRPVKMAALLAKYTRKLGGIETFRKADVGPIYDIAQVVAGSAEEFRRNPLLVGYAEVRSPLCFDANMVEIFMEYLRLGVPQTVDTMPAGGSTAPVTAAGVLALGAAETMAAVVLAYAVSDRAVVAMDITPTFADMSTGMYKYAGPDRCSLLMARVQLLSEFYGCPTGVHGGKTDSCFHDEQAGAEKAASMLLPVLAGAVGIGTVGHLENAVTFSPVQLVLDGEIARSVRRAIRQPLVVDAETLAAEVVQAVGAGGNFLDHPHTARHFREEVFLSSLFPALPWDLAHAKDGGKAAQKVGEKGPGHGPARDRDAAERAREIARRHWRPPAAPVLSDDQVRQIDRIVQRATG
jgi:trimethylamine--corrinoid protein Co-methyltransferase